MFVFIFVLLSLITLLFVVGFILNKFPSIEPPPGIVVKKNGSFGELTLNS